MLANLEPACTANLQAILQAAQPDGNKAELPSGLIPKAYW
jgi:hypothetical protein